MWEHILNSRIKSLKSRIKSLLSDRRTVALSIAQNIVGKHAEKPKYMWTLKCTRDNGFSAAEMILHTNYIPLEIKIHYLLE